MDSTWCSLSSICFCWGEGWVRPDRVCICAPTKCRRCCCSADKPWMGSWVLTTAVDEVFTGGAANWCCAVDAAGGLGDCDTGGISCWKGAGWEAGLGWGWPWMCGCVWGGWPCGAAWLDSGIWLWIIKSGGWDEGVQEREGVRDCGCGWEIGWDCCGLCGDWICWLRVKGDCEGWGLSATGGAVVWVVKAGEGDIAWIFRGCLCPLGGTCRSGIKIYWYA